MIATFTISHDHPALPGHFPGRPIVPGVVVLNEAYRAALKQLGSLPAIVGISQVKFLAPLLPGDVANVECVRTETQLKLIVTRDNTVIAQGVLNLAHTPS
jgi:3-hydroxyacyl-[acyl-carrier-protein] dehydratase